MMKPNRTIVSRRARPAKDPLSREIIVQTAYELLKNEGMSGMSMRKVAKTLDTGPSSLYVYFTNLQELSVHVLDYGHNQVILHEPVKGRWKEDLYGVLESYLMLLYNMPGLAELSLTTIPRGDNSFRLTEYILHRLSEGGITSKSAAWGVDLFLFYVSSVAFEQSSWKKNETEQMTVIKESYDAVDPLQYPFITGLRDEMFSGDTASKERFFWGLEVILKGILQTKFDAETKRIE